MKKVKKKEEYLLISFTYNRIKTKENILQSVFGDWEFVKEGPMFTLRKYWMQWTLLVVYPLALDDDQ